MSVGPPFQHPGSPPALPEVPDGVVAAAAPAPPVRPTWPRFPAWSPLLVFVMAGVVTIIGLELIVIFTEAAGTEVDSGDLPPGVTLGAGILQNISLAAGAVLIAKLFAGRPHPWDFGFRRTRFWPAFGWSFLTAVTFFTFLIAWGQLLGIEEGDDLAEELGAKDSTLNLIAVAVLVLLVAPFGEEFFFRGFCFPALAGKLGLLPGALLTGILFGATHAGGTDAVFLVPLAILGFLLCLLYRRTRSLLPCIALHATNNGLALSATLGWEPWQILLTVLLAPVLVTLIALPFSRREPPPPIGAAAPAAA